MCYRPARPCVYGVRIASAIDFKIVSIVTRCRHRAVGQSDDHVWTPLVHERGFDAYRPFFAARIHTGKPQRSSGQGQRLRAVQRAGRQVDLANDSIGICAQIQQPQRARRIAQSAQQRLDRYVVLSRPRPSTT